MRYFGSSLRTGFVSAASGCSVRALHATRPCLAQVSSPLPFSWSHSRADGPSRGVSDSESTEATFSHVQDYPASVQQKRERKLREYEAKIKVKAVQEGLSLEEFKRRSLEFATTKRAQQQESQSSADDAKSEKPTALSEVEKRDRALAQAIKERSQAEAAKKLASGQVHSTPNGSQEGPVKPLNKILDVEKLMTQDTETITKLWAGYHTIKNKLSAVIPTEKYLEMLVNARKYPQFVLPLPRQVVDGDSDSLNSTGRPKEAFEMQFLEWALVPGTVGEGLPPVATTLFTPLAEYKLKQDFSQPVLILTFYTDLSQTNGIVLMRGEITGLNENTGKGGRIDQAQAQLLALTLQRFYLSSSTSSILTQGEETNSSASAKLLYDFHKRPEQFDVEELINVAFRL